MELPTKIIYFFWVEKPGESSSESYERCNDFGKHKTGNILIERLQLIFLFAEDTDLWGSNYLAVTKPWTQPPAPQKTKQNSRKISPQNEILGV